MKRTNAGTLFPAGMFALMCFSGFAGEGEKKPALTFLDTLNKGKEITITAAEVPQQLQAAPQTQQPAVKAPADTPAGAGGSGANQEAGVVPSRFKIQVLASTQEQDFKKEKNNLAAKVNLAKIDLPVTSVFEAPYYKLFAGDFTQRSEAETWCARLKEMGYKDAWIVRTASPQKPR
jgi:hypothetical protein